MKKITLILILIAAFATKSFAHCPIPQWCPDAPLHQTLCPGEQIDPIEFPSVIAKVLIVTWWTNETRIYSTLTPPPGITVSGASTPTPLGDREYAWPVSIKGTPTAPGTHHYTVSNTCGVELLHGSITVAGPPTIGTVIPTIERYTTIDTAFAPLTLTAEPAGSMPPITIQWYSNTTASTTGGISMGTANGAQTDTFTPPSNVVNTDGIYCYAVATDRCGSTTTTNNTSGRHTIIHPIPTCPASTNPGGNLCTGNGSTFAGIGIPFFKTSTIWSISAGGINQEWSDVVLTSTCGKTGFAGGTTNNFLADCRENRTTQTNETRPTAVNQGGNTSAYLGDLFSWCAVVNHAATLCPGTWRVPTCQDFAELDIALGGDGSDFYESINMLAKYAGTSGNAWQFWGGAYVGFCDNARTDYQGSDAGYWSSSEATTLTAHHLYFVTNGIVIPQGEGNKNDGFALRCVRDN